MKNYKDFEKIYIGCSDVANLIMVGCKKDESGNDIGMVPELLSFGEDNCYYAYYVEGSDVEIGTHYRKVSSFEHWLRIYDDEKMTFNHYGNFNIYRAASMGCIIQKIN